MESGELFRSDVVCVVGTDTGVGKTVATAAIAVVLADAAGGRRVSVHKLVQAGPSDSGLTDANDIAVLVGLPPSRVATADALIDESSSDESRTNESSGAATGVHSVKSHTTLEFPMAPVAAAAREGVDLPMIDSYVDSLAVEVKDGHQLVIEGSGGLLVELDDSGHTMADVALKLSQRGFSVAVVVVCRSGLGTQNHTALTVEALQRRGITRLGVLVGALEAHPDEVVQSNLCYLRSLDVPFLGAIPRGAASLQPAAFQREAGHWFVVN